MPAKGFRIPIEKRFHNNKYDVDTKTGCWIWRSINGRRYGVLWMADGKSEYAHRVSYEIHKGKIPGGMFVCHTCDTPACVNPDHLYAGTPKDNSDDRIARGRMPDQRGTKNPRSKLDDEKVVAIMAHANGKLSQKAVGNMFGVGRKTVSAIWKGEAWRHVTGASA